MIVVLQIVGFVFSLSMIYLAILHYRRKTLSSNELAFWVLIWSLAIVMVSFPDLFRSFAQDVLVTRLFDLMVALGFVVVIIMATISYIKSRKNENKLEELVRELTLKEGKNGEK